MGGDKDVVRSIFNKGQGGEGGEGEGKADEGGREGRREDGEAEAQAQEAISEYTYVQQVTPLEIGDVVCLMACGGGWEVEAEEKRWEAYSATRVAMASKRRDVDLPFYFSGAPAEWVKKAEKNRDKMIAKKGPAEEPADAPADDAPEI
ncbi:hypothetical protein CYMTET_24761 [Cymbomonas tetramitiformis]|uniref:Uncharacterized protein n=1 Tax=Cymbomonas tetramitiformis TaxID=36881 RepID=A0AAE0FVR1_9CHLO|nr:hypothetical protein CYMTET_24761 [Cymbomonas tetramitiformis]